MQLPLLNPGALPLAEPPLTTSAQTPGFALVPYSNPGSASASLLEMEKFTDRLSKISEHSEIRGQYKRSGIIQRNGTMIHMHLTNRNGVPVRFEHWSACTK